MSNNNVPFGPKVPASAPAWQFAGAELMRIAARHVAQARWHYGDGYPSLGLSDATCASELMAFAHFFAGSRAKSLVMAPPSRSDEAVHEWRAAVEVFLSSPVYRDHKFAAARQLLARALRVDWRDAAAWLRPLPRLALAREALSQRGSGA